MLATKHNSLVSMTIASTILLLWFGTLYFCFQLDLNNLSPALVIIAVCLRTFLHTGVFIIIHESIHGVVSTNCRINRLMGLIAAFLYAWLPYDTIAKNHRQHHLHPATEQDPDFYSADPHNYWLWYASFMKDYQQGKQFWILFWGMTVIFFSFIGLQIPVANIFLFWVIPIILSSLQLFTFGIYLPHRPPKKNSNELNSLRDRHRAKSNNHPVFLSFLTCYHFGYHWEHHEYPHLPWYELPLVRR